MSRNISAVSCLPNPYSEPFYGLIQSILSLALGTVLGFFFLGLWDGLWDALAASRLYRIMRIAMIVLISFAALLAVIFLEGPVNRISVIIFAIIIIAPELVNWSWIARVKRAYWATFFALGIMIGLGSGLINVIIALGLVTCPGCARVIRGEVTNLKTQDFIDRDREPGASDSPIITRRLFPNTVNSLAPLLVRQLGFLILLEAFLAFLGFGLTPGTSSLAWTLKWSAEGDHLYTGPWVFVIPAAAIILLSVSFIMLGNRLRVRGGEDTASRASG